MNKEYKLVLWIVLLIGLLQIVDAYTFTGSSASSTLSVNPGTSRGSFENYYGGGSYIGFDTFYPKIEGKDTCTGRQDIMLRIPTGSCQPAVVRSDLLAEQNVPVFCQIEAIKINPLVDVTKIRTITFNTMNRSPEILDVGFHPSRVAINSRDSLMGSPIDRNIGYVVVVVKGNEKESELPDFVNVNLSAKIFYDTQNTLGIGRAEFVLKPVSDEAWEYEEKNKQSFWNGRYFLRLVDAESDYANIVIYNGDRIVTQTKILKGRSSGNIYLPGSYCRAGLQAEYAGLVKAENSARLEIGEPGGASDVLDVYQGGSFLDGKCIVRSIEINDTLLNTGRVIIDCSGKRITLKLGLSFPQFGGNSPVFNSNLNITSIDFGDIKYGIEKNGKLVQVNGNTWVEIEGYAYGNGMQDEKGRNLDSIRDGLLAYTNTLFKSDTKLQKPTYQIVPEADESLENAILQYETVVSEYPNTQINENSSAFYGEEALKEAIDLAEVYGKSDEAARLINKLINMYPDSSDVERYRNKLNLIALFDTQSASDVVYINGKYRTLRLQSLNKPVNSSKASFIVGNNVLELSEGEVGNLTLNGQQVGRLRLDKVQSESVLVTPICQAGNRLTTGSSGILYLDGKTETFCNVNVKLDRADLEKVAIIRLTPVSYGPETTANLSVNIGIEKRAIQIAPEKALDKIEQLNKSIQKWESISNNLANIVSTMKGACFATAGVLTVKNFISGLSGEGMARQKVMRGDNGWTNKCQDMVSRGKYTTLNDCYLGEASNINADVQTYKSAINEVNNNIKSTEEVYADSGGFLGDKTVNRDVSVQEYRKHLLEKYPNEKVNVNGKEVKVSDVLSNPNGYTEGEYSYEQLRDMELNLILRKQGSAALANNSQNELISSFERIQDNQLVNAKLKESTGINAYAPMALKTDKQQTQAGNVIPINRVNDKLASVLTAGGTNTVKDVVFMDAGIGSKEGKGANYVKEGHYAAGVVQDSEGNYGIRTMVEVNNTAYPVGEALDQTKINEFASTFNIGKITPQSRTTYNNKYLNPKVRYYDTEPYKGLPALVPFDIQRGWYAATRQTLPVLSSSSQGAYESSGRVANFWLCNVGKNGREQFEEGMGDDVCEQISSSGGQSYSFAGISDSREVKSLVDRAKNALQEAANQYGNKQVTINGYKITDVTAAGNVPTVQCQDFMDPKDCYALFNVCDPVICPASRCNLGGTYQVADVIQSGIIGSTVLCLPNIREKIAIPVCLSGIQAGIDSYLSILKSYRSCLQESVDNGRVVGICDQITSIYLCEFFWRQAAPAANVILPKLIDSIYSGNSARGGGEYLTVQGAWSNMQNSISYFKNTYAVNSLKAFQIRSIEEAGTPFCKAFISAKAPSQFKSLIEPDSPPQFSAWFSSIKLNDATLHSFDQYKVFYHLYSGKDSGVSYRVYLKDPPQSSYISIASEYTVASGFVAKGDYKTETIDVAAPSGYQQLCVSINGEENCGFKQVSSSFAVNYAKDEYVSSEIERSDITSAKECSSGGVNVAAVLANTNPQSAVEEAALGQNSQRGIVRVCATNNPGISTDPMRYSDVGYCDDPKIRCWLDSNSVDRAITSSDLLVKNKTLTEIKASQMQALENSGEIMPESDIDGKIYDFNQRLKDLKAATVLDKAVVRSLTNEIEEVISKTYWNRQKAELLLIEARVLDVYARSKMNAQKAEVSTVISSNTGASVAQPGSSEEGYTINNTSSGFSLSDSSRKNILSNGKTTGLYISGSGIYTESGLVGNVRAESGGYRLQFIEGKLGDAYNDLKSAEIEKSDQSTEGRNLKIISSGTGSSAIVNEEGYVISNTAGGFNIEDGTEKEILFNGESTGLFIQGGEIRDIKDKVGEVRMENDRIYRLYLIEYFKGRISTSTYEDLCGATIGGETNEQDFNGNLRLVWLPSSGQACSIK